MHPIVFAVANVAQIPGKLDSITEVSRDVFDSTSFVFKMPDIRRPTCFKPRGESKIGITAAYYAREAYLDGIKRREDIFPVVGIGFCMGRLKLFEPKNTGYMEVAVKSENIFSCVGSYFLGGMPWDGEVRDVLNIALKNHLPAYKRSKIAA